MARKIKLVDSRIVNGTIGFGVAHIFYIFAFYNLSSQTIVFWELSIGIILLCSVYYFFIYSPDLSKSLKMATLGYSLIIATLFVVIIDFVGNPNNKFHPSIFAISGIILFILSDSIIAYTEFKGILKHSSQIIAITYILSQILLQSTIIFIGV